MSGRLGEVAPGLLVATSRRYSTTSSVLIGEGGEAVVVDPAWDPDELQDLADELAGRGLGVVAGVSTHFHHDHVLWHPGLGDVPRWASAPTVAIVEEHRAELLAELGPDWPPELAPLVGGVRPLTGRDLVIGGLSIEVIVHDAHAPGHLAVWVPDTGVLLGGDMLSDVELPLPSPDDRGLVNYAAGLEVLAPYARRARVLVPGHGTPTASPGDRVDADLRYLDGVLRGLAVDDPRLAEPGMREAHRHNRALVT